LVADFGRAVGAHAEVIALDSQADGDVAVNSGPTVAGDDVAGAVRGAPDLHLEGGVEMHAVAGVGNGRAPRGVGADVVALDGRVSAAEHVEPEAGVARDDIAIGDRRATDGGVVGLVIDEDAVVAVAEVGRAIDTYPDVVAGHDGPGDSGVVELCADND